MITTKSENINCIYKCIIQIGFRRKSDDKQDLEDSPMTFIMVRRGFCGAHEETAIVPIDYKI